MELNRGLLYVKFEERMQIRAMEDLKIATIVPLACICLCLQKH